MPVLVGAATGGFFAVLDGDAAVVVGGGGIAAVGS
jgi:hypothetical protein